MKSTLKIGIVGSRDFDNYEMLLKTMDWVIETFGEPSLVISGGSGRHYPENRVEKTKSADMLAERFADECGIEKLVHEADWGKYNASAGPIRNTKIVADSDIIVVFWDTDFNKKRSGSKDTVQKALAKKMKVVSVNMFNGHIQVFN
jgi:hypothetical protein